MPRYRAAVPIDLLAHADQPDPLSNQSVLERGIAVFRIAKNPLRLDLPARHGPVREPEVRDFGKPVRIEGSGGFRME